MNTSSGPVPDKTIKDKEQEVERNKAKKKMFFAELKK
jgi:hypothetical protein